MAIGTTFGGYTTGANAISAAAQADVIANINLLKALIPNPEAGVSAAHTDFDQIQPDTARRLRAEIDALIVAIDATATA